MIKLKKKTVALVCGALLAVSGCALAVNGAIKAHAEEEQAQNTILLDAGQGELGQTSITLNEDGTLPQLPAPTRAGWEFVGWFDSEVIENFWGDEEFENTPEDYKTLKDKYSAKEYKNVLYQGKVISVEMLDGDDDRGWKELTFNWVCITEGEQVFEGGKVNAGQTLYAMYSANRYTVYWHLNGWLNTYDEGNTAHRTLPEHGGYFVEYELDEFSSLKWENHEFLGWYKDPACTEEYKFNQTGQYKINDEQVNGDIHLYAKWQALNPFDGEIRLNKLYNLVEPKAGETFTVNCSYLLGESKDKPIITKWEASVPEVVLVSSDLYSAVFVIENNEIFKDIKQITIFVTVDGVKYPAVEATIGHSWGKIVQEIEPTCTEGGKTVYSCKYCSQTRTVEHTANGHRFIQTVHPATCTEDEFVEINCIVCGLHETKATENSKLGHSWSTRIVADCNGTATTVTCENCGISETTFDENAVVHSWESHCTVDIPATCVTDGEQSIHCRNCDEKKDVNVIPATGEHVWGEWTVISEPTAEQEGVSSHSCEVCGKSETQAIPAIPVEPEEPEVPEIIEPDEPEIEEEIAVSEKKRAGEVAEDMLENPSNATVFGTGNVKDIRTAIEVEEGSKAWIIAVAACVVALIGVGAVIFVKRNGKAK